MKFKKTLYKIIFSILSIIFLVPSFNSIAYANSMKKSNFSYYQQLYSKGYTNKHNLELINKMLHIDNQQIQKGSSDYYPEEKGGRLEYEDVKRLHDMHYKQAKTLVESLELIVIGKILGLGFGFDVLMAFLQATKKEDPFIKALEKAYEEKKGITMYITIHKSVTSLNKMRYVVE